MIRVRGAIVDGAFVAKSSGGIARNVLLCGYCSAVLRDLAAPGE